MRRLRTRRLAAALPARDPEIEVDPSDTIAAAVETALSALQLSDTDVAIAALARQYALAIDTAERPSVALRDLGPKLLACLEHLGAVPSRRVVP